MSGLARPDFRADIADLRRRLEVIERRQRPAAAVTDTSHEIIFSFAGTITASTSPPARVRRGGNLSVLAVTFDTAGSTATIIDVLRNGTAVETVTVPASTTTHNAQVGAQFAADVDTLALAVTAAGTGAADMTAEARFT